MRKAFTAIELMIVVAVLMLLMGIMVPVIVGMRNRAKVRLAKSRLSVLCVAIEQYKLKHGIYPRDSGGQADLDGDGSDPCSLYQALAEYMEFPKEELRPEGSSFILLDPWGNPWVFEENFSHFNKRLSKDDYETLGRNLKPRHPLGFDLYSFGPDGLLDPKNDGLDNNEPKNGKIDEREELVDDITNW